jgi:glyoxylase-like metal-dependent hydrolase (beta-lactamase superfamily II)
MDDFIQPISDEYKNILFVNGARDGKYPYSNSLLIEDILIDTGISSRLLRKLKRIYPINIVLLSHWHEDHTSGNRLLPNVKFFIHPKDKFLVENVNKFNEFYGILNTPAELESELFMEGLKLENTDIDEIIENGDVIKVGDTYKVKIIHTPGHTAGHCAFLELNSKIAFLADIDLTNFVFYAGIDSNLIEFEESLDKLGKLSIKTAVTGHKGIFEGEKVIKEELSKYKQIIDKRDHRILSYFSETEPIGVMDLKKNNLIYKYYSSQFKEYEIIAEMIMIQKHFDKFLENRLIEQKKNGYILS